MKRDLFLKYHERFKKATLMDDLKFRKVCESKEVTEEILRVILNDDALEVLESTKQESVDEPIFHGVILDCKCKLSTSEIVNIEVQVALDDNPLYRMRYNGSILTVENSPKSKMFKYENIPRIILIMFCEFDYFELGKAIYEIDRVVKETNIKAPNGIRELYVNLRADAKDQKLKSLFKIMTTVNDIDKKAFPRLSQKKEEVNDLYLGGKNNMSGLTKEIFLDGMAEGKIEGKTETFVNLFKQGVIDANVVMKNLGLTKLEFEKLLKEYQ